MPSIQASPTELLEVINKAQLQGLCPNRIWQSGARINNWQTALSEYLPSFCQNLPQDALVHEDHSACTLDYCEFSSRNFTAVLQYHEHYPYEIGRSQAVAGESHADAAVCFPVCGLFDDAVLAQAVGHGHLTPWALDGQTILPHPRPYMAISHVWSDGTGLGPWPTKQVHFCLYEYFCNMASRFGCEGLWWDTLCVPQDREARGKALKIMDLNYAYARLTLVHDRFLRALPFAGPDAACFALVMSAWFTRGWTALELARSRRVKVVFADSVRDLDREILDKASEENLAANIIRQLRSAEGQQAPGLDDLLNTLAPRYTSWAKDRATIAGLLARIPPNPDENRETWQRDIYQDILKAVGSVSHGHLFHRSATMSGGFGWCPTDIFELPQTRIPPELTVESNGDLTGLWGVVALQDETVRVELLEKAVWGSRHPLLEETVRQAIHHDWRRHLLLVVPLHIMKKQSPGGSNGVINGVIVKLMRKSSERGAALLKFHFVGSLDLHPAADLERDFTTALTIGDTSQWNDLDATEDASHILSNNEEAEDLQRISIRGAVDRSIKQSTTLHSDLSFDGACRWTELHHAAWLQDKDLMIKCLSLEDQQDIEGQSALHLACERGVADLAELLLSTPEVIAHKIDHRDANGQTPLHKAAWGGSLATVRLILRHGNQVDSRDKKGRTALHLAAEQGFDQVVRCLCDQAMSIGLDLLNATTSDGLTALHYASLNGHYEVVRVLTENARATAINSANNLFKWTSLHLAADTGHAALFQLLMEAGARIEQPDVVGWTALHIAAMSGHVSIVQLLVRERPDLIWLKDCQDWLPIDFAVANGHRGVVEALMLLNPQWDLSSVLKLLSMSAAGQKLSSRALDRAVRWQHMKDFLIPALSRVHGCITRSESAAKLTWSRMHLAAVDGRLGVTRRLLEGPVGRNSKQPHRTLSEPLHWAAHDGLFGTISLFIQIGVTLEAKNEQKGWTPLWVAAVNGLKLMVRLLLENGANGQVTNNDRMTLLTWAATKGADDIVELLLSTGRVGPDDSDDCNSLPPISYAAEAGHENVVRRLLATGRVNLAPTGNIGSLTRTPLYYAVRGGHANIVRILIEAGGAVGVTSDTTDGHPNPVVMAAIAGNSEMMRLLLDNGARVGDKVLNRFALSYAAEKGHAQIVQMILQEPFKTGLNEQDGWPLDWTPLFYAAKNGHEDVVRLLLKAVGLQIFRLDKHSRTPLFYAAMFGFEGIVRLLLDAELGADDEDVFYHKPRWYADMSGYPEVVDILDAASGRSKGRWSLSFRQQRGSKRSAAGRVGDRYAYLNRDLAPFKQSS